MSATLTEKEFSKHLASKFRINIEEPIELELAEVKSYSGKANEQGGMERFSLFFRGPNGRLLPQHVYRLEHEDMGVFELFLVPIGRDEGGFRYEAVFNYYKEESAS